MFSNQHTLDEMRPNMIKTPTLGQGGSSAEMITNPLKSTTEVNGETVSYEVDLADTLN